MIDSQTVLPLPTESSPSQAWKEEHLFLSGDRFFDSLIESIDRATSSINIQVYIFEADECGERVADALAKAAQRSVRVRIIVDAIGSPRWEQFFGEKLSAAGVRYRIFHELPWHVGSGERLFGSATLRITTFFRRMNRRNHRKLILIDQQTAWLGSMNISAVHLESLRGKEAWRDTGISVLGEGVKVLELAFEQSWSPRLLRFQRRFRPLQIPSSLVRLNTAMRQRRFNYQDLLRRLSEATERIWITTAYFVPPADLVHVLESAAKNGLDVRILVPGKSDIVFMPWVASAFHHSLIVAGVRVFEYQPRVLHAKTLIIDDWATIGSSNLNHRSIFHDLEVNVVVTTDEAKEELVKSFLHDLDESIEVELGVWNSRSLFVRLLGRTLLLFRNWL